jgi:hypothetical protein
MKAITQDAKTIFVFDGELKTGRLVYKNWYSSKAGILDSEQHLYEIVPVNIWKTSFEVKDGAKAIISFKRKWKGTTLLQTYFGFNDKEYTFRRKGLFNRRYLLTDKDDREMLVVRTKFIWKKFRYNYNIEVSDSFRRHPQYLLIVTLMVYLCREYISREASHVAAAS